jgi:hypothetical protein
MQRHEVIDFLTDIEDYHNADNQQDSNEEGQNELLNDIYVKFLQNHNPK